MNAIDLDIEPKKTVTDVLKPVTDRVTRERPEHPDRIPSESTSHPVTRARTVRRERIGAK
jgi:hypothetical protein